MARALVTGGAGFIGYHLARRLADRGLDVVLADNFSRGVRDHHLEELSGRSNVRLLEADLRKSAPLRNAPDGFHLVYHLAAIIGVRHVTNAPFDVLWSNVLMLRNALDAARRQPDLRRFVFASTSEVYAGTLEHFDLDIPTPESTPLAVSDLRRPRTSYMLSKIYGEVMCLHSGLPVTIVRPHNFYGPRMGLSHVVPELFRKACYAEGDSLEVLSPDHRRSFCYIDDAVEMMRLLAESEESTGRAFNVGRQGPEPTMRELAAMIVDIAGGDLEITDGPVTPGSPGRRCPDMTRTLEVTGYSPRVTLAEGLRRTFEWYRRNVFGEGGVSAV
jgi:nucleoside-diphosphate-sugar epimerase